MAKDKNGVEIQAGDAVVISGTIQSVSARLDGTGDSVIVSPPLSAGPYAAIVVVDSQQVAKS